MRFGRLVAGIVVVLAALGGTPPSVASAQGSLGIVTGRVTDAAAGTPIVGANVRVAGTPLGTQSAEDGRFTLRGVPAGSVVLQVTRIGYEARQATATVVAGQTATVDVGIPQAAFSLAAVVTTVTGLQRKVELANTTAQINLAQKAAELPVMTVANVLSGRAAGVQIVSNGATGSGSRVRIRGQSSLSLTSEPVVFIDGVRVSSGANSSAIGVGGSGPSRLDDINPDEIESIEVIKGPSAATLYGTEAANGVISVMTKKGKAGRTRYTVTAENGIVENSRPFPDLYSLWGKTQGQTASRICTLTQVLGGCVVDSLSHGNIMNIDSLSPLQTGNRQKYGAQVTGGSERVQFFLSGETEGELGVYKMPQRDIAHLQEARGVGSLPTEQIYPNALRRNSFRANLSSQLAPSLTAQIQSGYVNSYVRLPQNEDNSDGIMVDAMGSTWRQDLNDAFGYPLLGARSWPMGEVFSQTTTQDVSRFINGAGAQYNPLPWLTARATIGYDFTARIDQYLNKVNEGPTEGQIRLGRADNYRTELSQRTVDVGGTGTFDLLPGLQAKTSVGMQYIRNLVARTGATGISLPPGAVTVTAGATRTSSEQTAEKRTLGYYAEEVLGYNDKLFVTAAVRRDAASAFGDKVRSVYYPKLGASWLVSDQGFFPKSSWLNTLRLRATYGASGQIPGATDALRYYTANAATQPNGGDAPSFSLGALGNTELRPEFSAETEAGFDLTLFDGRSNLELTYYDKATRDAIIQRRVAPSISGLQSRFENIGNIQNKGLEVVWNQRLVETRQVGASFTLTGSTNANKMTSIAEGVSAIYTGNRNTQRNQPGYPLFGLWSRTYTYADKNSDGILALGEMTFSDSLQFIGPSYPTRELSFSPSLELFNRALRFSAQLDSKWGYKKFNNTLRHRCQGGASCRGLYDKSASLEEQAAAIAVNQVGVFAGMFEDGAFTRFREASVAYTIPARYARALRAQALNVILTGRNLGVWTDYSGVDPEASRDNSDTRGAEEYFATPPLRVVSLRLNVTF